MTPSVSVDRLGAGKALVIVRRCGDELIGCGGAILSHLEHADPLSVLIVEEAPDLGGEVARGQGARGDWPRASLGLAAGEIGYTEDLIAQLQSRIAAFQPDLVYSGSPSEPLSANRAIALAVCEAIRRSGQACRLAFFELEAQLQPNALLDISGYLRRKTELMEVLAADPESARLVRAAQARDTYRALGLQGPGAAAEPFVTISAVDLQRLHPGGPAPLLMMAAEVRAPIPSVSAPLVSVIIRSIGRPEIADALNSLALQTYPNIEAVVVQASAGPPLELPRQVGQVPVRLVSQGEALRRSRAANLGLTCAGGDYLAFLDDDDWWLPEHLSGLMEAVTRGPERAVYSGVRCVRKQGDDWLDAHQFDDPFDAARLLVDNFIPIHAVLFHRSLVEAGCRFDEDLDVYEDWDFWVQIGRLTPLHHVEGVTAIYRLAAGTGFGVDASREDVETSLRRFFDKWHHHWTDAEWRAVIERARSAQGIPVMQRQVRVLESQRDQYSDHNRVLFARRVELERLVDEAQERARTLEGRLVVEHLVEIERVRSELLALLEERRVHYEQFIGQVAIERDLAQQRLGELYRSTSWRLTAPVRGAGLALRFLRSRSRAFVRAILDGLLSLYRGLLPKGVRRRLAPATAMIAARLPTGESAEIEDGWAPPTYQAAPLPILRLQKSQFAGMASALVIPTSDDPLVSVVMPVFNHPGYTLECLGSIAQYPPRLRFELILIDDASQESNRQLLRTVRGIRLIENADNLGFLRSCNKAAAAARGRYLMFLNNDTQVRDGWLDRLVEPFADPAVGMTGSKLLYPSGHLQEAGVSMKPDGTARLIGLNGDPNDSLYNAIREVDYCSGASFMVEREVFERIGGFDDRYAPAYFEDADLAFAVRSLGRKILYQPASEVVHHLSVTTGASGDKLARIEANRDKFIGKWTRELADLDRVRLISFYLPQFHPIPENDAWWGEGFTEWTNVTRARPNFPGHYQPHLPADLGFYDLRLAEARQKQADLARRSGIHGFCYYYYWFNGQRLLHRPLDDVLASGEPDFPFCVCWANENWSRRWDGRESDILMAQHYSPEDDVAFIRALFPALSDRRYIRIDGRPLLMIYRASLLPDAQATTDRWREECLRAGLPEPYLANVYSFNEQGCGATGFDAAVEFPPHGHAVRVEPPEGLTNPNFRGRFFDYPATARAFAALRYPEQTVFRGVMPAWDNTARRQNDADIFVNGSPEVYEAWLRRMVAETRDVRFGDERILFINAWNEWAEGNHLEPDTQFGSAYLEATRRALDSVIVPRGSN